MGDEGYMVTKELIDQFRERVNKNNYVLNKYRNIDGKNKWSCICSCMDWISVAISYLSENPIPIQYGNDDLTSVNVYTYISCIDMVFEAIKQLHRIFVSEKGLPFENESSIFTENEYCKNDNDYFKLIRSCFGAHPVNLNDYFTSGNLKERRFASWSGGHFSRRDYGVILYSNCPSTKDIFFDISFKELDAFLVRTYSYLNNLIGFIDNEEELTIKALMNKTIQFDENPLRQLEILEKENVARYNNGYYKYVIEELKVIFGVRITNPNNLIKVNQYRKTIEPAIAELRSALQAIDLEEINSFEKCNLYGSSLPHSVSSGLTELADRVFSNVFSYPIFLPSLIKHISSVLEVSGHETDVELYVLAKTAFYFLDNNQ